MIICSLCGRNVGATKFVVVKNEGRKNISICDKCYENNNMKVVIKHGNEEYDVEEVG